MRKKVFRLDNRGAALVSIMIAVAFISILASAFLYMSYNNFTMKVTNYESKQNFYETEQQLMQMSSKLRSEVMASSNPLNELKSIAGVDAMGRYDSRQLAALAFGTTPGGTADKATITYNADYYTVGTKNLGTNYTEVEINDTVTKVTLHDINITKHDSESDSQNSITTDFVMYIEEFMTAKNAGGIGEFSFLMDSPMNISGNGTKLNVFGNCFAMSTVFEDSKSMPGTFNSGNAALYLTENSNLNVLGDQMIVYGDLVIANNATLNIIGAELTVFGDIYLLGPNSTIVCTGVINFPSQADTRNNSGSGDKYEIYVRNGSLDTNDASLVREHILPHTFSVNILPDASMDTVMTKLHTNDADATNDGIVNNITQPQNGKEFDDASFSNNGPSTNAIPFAGETYYSAVNKESALNGGLYNCLLFNRVDATMKYENVNTTIISRKPISFSEVHTVTVTKMGTHAFNYLIAKEGTANYTANHAFTKQLSDTSNKYTIGGFFTDDANTVVGELLGGASSVSGEIKYESSLGYQNWVKE